jgi:phenylpropionate dioxygenase-like ring-hydroxylating dioxygenase large terminal subunit
MTQLSFPSEPLPALHAGWYLLCFGSEIGYGLTPLSIGNRRLMALRERNQIRVFDASCPHRGAHLACGGRVADEAVICPFHRKRIALGGPGRLTVAEHEVLQAGDAVFVRLSADPAHDRGFRQVITDLAADACIVGLLTDQVPVPPELVLENAFDVEHFSAVHGIPGVTGMEVKTGDHGELVIQGEFSSSRPAWKKGADDPVSYRYYDRAFSPTLVIGELGSPDRSSVVISAASPAPGGCTTRIAIAIRSSQLDEFADLAAGTRYAIEQDLKIWRNIDLAVDPVLDASDRASVAFRNFCAEFPAP